MNINDLTKNTKAAGVVPEKQKATLLPLYTDNAGVHTQELGVALQDGRLYRAFINRNRNAANVGAMARESGELEILVNPAGQIEFTGHGGFTTPVGELRNYNFQAYRPGSTKNKFTQEVTPNRFDSVLLATSSSPTMPLTSSPNLATFLRNLMGADTPEEKAALVAWLPKAFCNSFEVTEEGDLHALDAQGEVTIAAIENVFGGQSSQEQEVIDTQDTTNPVDTFAA